MNRLDPETTDACIWMSAGVLSYKLCDRGFECEHCPLDAALHGVPQELVRRHPARAEAQHNVAMIFPGDRLYSVGHTWVQPPNGCREGHRFGLDGFATALITCPRHVRWNAAPRVLQRGETICAIEFDGGLLRLGAPVVARLNQRNEALDDDPGAVVAAPYGEGWIVDLREVEESEVNDLLPAEAAKEQARLDLRRFRRRIALHLLAAAGSVGPDPAEDGELLTDPRRILGGANYLELVQELIH